MKGLTKRVYVYPSFFFGKFAVRRSNQRRRRGRRNGAMLTHLYIRIAQYDTHTYNVSRKQRRCSTSKPPFHGGYFAQDALAKQLTVPPPLPYTFQPTRFPSVILSKYPWRDVALARVTVSVTLPIIATRRKGWGGGETDKMANEIRKHKKKRISLCAHGRYVCQLE